MTIRAIETRYNNHRFRSRLEARWAVYFDAIGLEWRYEDEGFEIEGVRYLPDFWLPQVRMFAEVKPSFFNPDDLRKAALLAWKLAPVILLDGPPAERGYSFLENVECNTWGEVGIEIGISVGEDESLLQEQTCVISMYHGYPVTEHRFYTNPGDTSRSAFYDGGQFDDVPPAIRAALSARFEFGESG